MKSIALPQYEPDYNKNNDGAKAATSKFFCAIPCNESSKDIIHYSMSFLYTTDGFRL